MYVFETAVAEDRKHFIFVFQYQLADRSPELIMEVTALRAKVTEMEDMILKTKVESRQLARIDCEVNRYSSYFVLI